MEVATRQQVEQAESMLSELEQALATLRGGDASVLLPGDWPGRWGRVALAFNEVTHLMQPLAEQDWLKTYLARFSRMLQGHKDLATLAHAMLLELAPVVGAQHAELYVLQGTHTDRPRLRLLASYASQGQGALGSEIALGEGLVGQCALDGRKIVLEAQPQGAGPSVAPAAGPRIAAGMLSMTAANVIVLPITFERRPRGVLELASLRPFSALHQNLLDQLAESIGVAINIIEANMRTEALLVQSQSLAHELRQANEALEVKARQLALTSKYKTEFLANMSHELRTPLNSLLILSDQLWRNAAGNLTPRQVEFARTIHSSGTDLLGLITDILDLSKIESGTVVPDLGELRLDELRDYVERTFRHVAEAKGLEFEVDASARLPAAIVTDVKRLQQILKNLLANAFKFTHQGRVSLRIADAPERRAIEFEVADTGIGIPPDKQQVIFEAFQQADGSTSRKYGGTGLGLAISRELARLLAGEIRLSSTPGQGSMFTLQLPMEAAADSVAGGRIVRQDMSTREAGQPMPSSTELFEDEHELQQALPDPAPSADTHGQEPELLLVSQDEDLRAQVRRAAAGWHVVDSAHGAEALTRANCHAPSGIVLDARLPDMDAGRLAQRFAQDLRLRHVPVCVVDEPGGEWQASQQGAWAVVPLESAIDPAVLAPLFTELQAWLERPRRTLLLAVRDDAVREQLCELLPGEAVDVCVPDSEEALRSAWCRGWADVLVIDEGTQVPALPKDHKAWTRSRPVLHAAAEAAHDQAATLAVELLACLRLAPSLLSPHARMLAASALDAARPLTGKRALIVDDDMRNIFALATVLEEQGMDIVWADNGREAIARVAGDAQIDVVLMDLMMPELDGMSTMHELRRLPQGRDLPVIAVTAKAMKGDREKCIAAGAWDYLAKPVETQDLLAVLRAWLD